MRVKWVTLKYFSYIYVIALLQVINSLILVKLIADFLLITHYWVLIPFDIAFILQLLI